MLRVFVRIYAIVFVLAFSNFVSEVRSAENEDEKISRIFSDFLRFSRKCGKTLQLFEISRFHHDYTGDSFNFRFIFLFNFLFHFRRGTPSATAGSPTAPAWGGASAGGASPRGVRATAAACTGRRCRSSGSGVERPTAAPAASAWLARFGCPQMSL